MAFGSIELTLSSVQRSVFSVLAHSFTSSLLWTLFCWCWCFFSLFARTSSASILLLLLLLYKEEANSYRSNSHARLNAILRHESLKTCSCHSELPHDSPSHLPPFFPRSFLPLLCEVKLHSFVTLLAVDTAVTHLQRQKFTQLLTCS